MTSQLFKKNIPSNLFFNFLNNNCLKNDKHYIFNKNSYKKGLFNETITKFIQDCKPYYHISKQKYLEKNITYSSFLTILRQICNFNKVTYTSKIIYDKSTYEIIYFIYI